MNLIEIVSRVGDLRQFAAMMDAPLGKVLFVILLNGIPTIQMLDDTLRLGNELSITETAIDSLELKNG